MNKKLIWGVVIAVVIIIGGRFAIRYYDATHTVRENSVSTAEDCENGSVWLGEFEGCIKIASDNIEVIDSSVVAGYFTGYYSIEKFNVEPNDLNIPNGPMQCEVFAIQSGNKAVINHFKEMVNSGNVINSIDENGNLVINLDTKDLNDADMDVLNKSNANNPITLILRKEAQEGRDAQPCYSFFKILAITN